MEVVDREHISFPGLKPSFFIQTLAFGAVSISARVVGNPQSTAAITLFHMTTKLGGAADLNGTHGTQVPEGHRLSMGITIGSSKGPENMGHLQQPFHENLAYRVGFSGSSKRSMGFIMRVRSFLVTWR